LTIPISVLPAFLSSSAVQLPTPHSPNMHRYCGMQPVITK
jgi:hypothetical protein